VATFQRAYLTALIPRSLVHRIIAGLRADKNEVWGSIYDANTAEVIFKSEGMPGIGTVTLDRCAPTRAEVDLVTVPTWCDHGHTYAGTDVVGQAALRWAGNLRERLAPGIGDAIIAQEGLCCIGLEESAFCVNYPRSLPARLLLWLTAA
jgi:hypothetical protein